MQKTKPNERFAPVFRHPPSGAADFTLLATRHVGVVPASSLASASEQGVCFCRPSEPPTPASVDKGRLTDIVTSIASCPDDSERSPAVRPTNAGRV